MKWIFLTALIMGLRISSFAVEPAESDFYTETIHLVDQTVDLATDYGANGSDTNDDSVAIQAAIDDMTTNANGGVVHIPSGTFYFDGVRMKSNVHLEVDAGAILVPAGNDDERTGYIHSGRSNYNEISFDLDGCS
ncbi:glycosyl hydrolase family 28-related protein [Pontiella sulfatireligans]|uniref:Iota-carrageenase n=1 Tax=Pontiella sulfatireligans TaxID=2750658 RepID=A0A6C2UEF3_9BACT|nr:glycosyl hydrolase family 28-related protein [Pontiella sulfatireligans]VGO18535.1 Iota-carrageenase [Pontiella sulfatireligans]